MLELSGLLVNVDNMPGNDLISKNAIDDKKPLPDEIRILNCAHWPDLQPVPLPEVMKDADLKIGINSTFMRQFILKLFNHPIEFPFTKLLLISNNFL